MSNSDFQQRARQVQVRSSFFMCTKPVPATCLNRVQAQSTHSAASTATVERFDAASLMAAPSSRSAPLHTATAHGVGAPGFVLAESTATPSVSATSQAQAPLASMGGVKRSAGAAATVPAGVAAASVAAPAAKRQATATAQEGGTVLLPSNAAVPLPYAVPPCDGNVSLSQEALQAAEAEVERRRRIEENKRLALQRRQALVDAPVNTPAVAGKPASLNSSAGSINSAGGAVPPSPGSPEV